MILVGGVEVEIGLRTNALLSNGEDIGKASELAPAPVDMGAVDAQVVAPVDVVEEAASPKPESIVSGVGAKVMGTFDIS